MGLAPYGEPKYVDLIKENLIDVKEDGTFKLNMKYFNYATGLKMTSKKFDQIFGNLQRKPEMKIAQAHMDLARSIQLVTEEIVLKIVKNIYKEFKTENLCLAGGVALNCVSNGRLLREGPFKNIWVQPAAGDAGGSLGAALILWYEYLKNSRNVDKNNDKMQGSYLGCSYNNDEIKNSLDSLGGYYELIEEDKIFDLVASKIQKNNVVGWFSGKMEFGPRALGNRSILGNPMDVDMQKKMNLRIKYRESFRPFAPAIKLDKVSEWFDIAEESPYMLFVSQVTKEKLLDISETNKEFSGLERLKIARSLIPAVTHVDCSARIQTVSKTTNQRFYSLLDSFEKISDCPILINTSFNVRGEPIVCSIEDAYRCFMRTEMDYLVIENYLLSKKRQSNQIQDKSWKNEFELD